MIVWFVGGPYDDTYRDLPSHIIRIGQYKAPVPRDNVWMPDHVTVNDPEFDPITVIYRPTIYQGWYMDKLVPIWMIENEWTKQYFRI